MGVAGAINTVPRTGHGKRWRQTRGETGLVEDGGFDIVRRYI